MPATVSARSAIGSIRRVDGTEVRATLAGSASTARVSPPWTPTATRPPASGCRRSRCRSRPIPAGTSTRALPSELCDRDGSYIPFAKTKAEREAAGDPRPSIEERYGSRADYVAKVKAAADALVRDRLLLPADAAAYVRAAEASDRFCHDAVDAT